MRVAFVVDTIDRFNSAPIGGVEVQVQRWQSYLAERGHEASIININGAKGSKLVVPSPDELDIVHAVGIWSQAQPAVLRAYSGKVPVVVSPVYNDRSTMLATMLESLERRKYQHIEEFRSFTKSFTSTVLEACNLANKIVVLGDGERQALMQIGASSDKDHYAIIPNGVDVAAIQAVERSWKIPVSNAVILPARCEINKNQLAAIEAFREFLFAVPQAALWLVGEEFDQEYAEECRAAADGLPVYWLGLRPTWEALYLLKAARVVILPSISECLPLAVLEAAAFGKPIVCTPNSYVSEYLSHENIIIMRDVTPDWILEGMRKAWLLPDSKQFANDVRQRLSWERSGGELLGLYSRMLHEWIGNNEN